MASEEFEDVTAIATIPDGGNRAFDVGEHDVLLCRVGAAVFAVRNRCTHAFSPLEGGAMTGTVITCPLHGARFDVSSGRALGGDCPPLTIYPVSVKHGRVLVRAEPGE